VKRAPGAGAGGAAGVRAPGEAGRRAAGWSAAALGGAGLLVLVLAAANLGSFGLVRELEARRDRFLHELANHLALAGAAVGAALLAGVPLGVLAFRRRRLERPIFLFVNAVQTIPSLALFGILIVPLSALSQRVPFLRSLGVRGIGWAPALLALALYALLPVTRNTFTGLRVIDPAIAEAGIGMGMSRRQLLVRVELPLALPILVSGVRVSLVQAIGNTTVAALIGAGGLGVFVFQGLGQAVPDLILLGALPVILLAALTDRLMQALVRRLTPAGLAVRGAP
jgi:osmoprotectant transport system permease protein